MVNGYTISEKIKDILLSSNYDSISSINSVNLFMIPPTDRLPSVCIVPSSESYSSFTSHYFNTSYEFTIDVYDYSYNKKHSHEKTVSILNDIRKELDSGSTLNGFVDVVDISDTITNSERKLGDKYLAWSSLNFTIENKKRYDINYKFSNNIITDISFGDLKDKFLTFFRNNLNSYFNDFNVVPDDDINTHPSLTLNFRDANYDYKQEKFVHSNITLDMGLLSKFYFRDEIIKRNINNLEEIKKLIKSNSKVGGYCESLEIDNTDYAIDKVSGNFFNITTLSCSLILRNE